MISNAKLTLTNDPDLGWSPGYVHMPVPVGEISDGHYTFNELYAKIKELQERLDEYLPGRSPSIAETRNLAEGC